MDYAFAPGTTDYDNAVKELLRQRPNTTLINVATVNRVDQFIDHLETDASVTRPVENIIVASHGNDSGWMEIQLANIDTNGDFFPDTDITYEVLVEADNTNVVEVPSTVIDPRPVVGGNPQPAFFHIKGCKIGQTPDFVQKLKDALGGSIQVTAPKHYHNVSPPMPGVGVIETLGYDFGVAQPTAFANRTQLITAFQGAGHQFIDNSPVANESWGRWLPRNISPGRRNVTFTVTFDPPIQQDTTTQITTIGFRFLAFRHEVQRSVFRFLNWAGPLPASQADKISTFRSMIVNHPRYDPAQTNFPVYERYELADLQAFLDGFTWNITWDSGTGEFVAAGSRHRYTIVVPITDPATHPGNRLNRGNVFFNFYPYTGNTTGVITQLLESDTRFFLTI